MDAVVRVEVGDDDVDGVVAKPDDLAVQPAPAIGHRRALADDDAGLERVEDVEEVDEPVGEEVVQPGHVLATLEVGLTVEPARVGQRRAASCEEADQVAPLALEPVELATTTGGGQPLAAPAKLGDPVPDERLQAVDLGQPRPGVGQRERSRPPVRRGRLADPAEGHTHAAGHHDGLVEPVEVERQDEPGDDFGEPERQQERAEDQQPAHQTGHDLEEALDEACPERVAGRDRRDDVLER